MDLRLQESSNNIFLSYKRGKWLVAFPYYSGERDFPYWLPLPYYYG